MVHPSPSQHHHSGSGEPTHALDELSQLLDRLEGRVETARRMHWDGLVQAANPSARRLQRQAPQQQLSSKLAPSPARTGLGRFLSRRRSGEVPETPPPPAPPTLPAPAAAAPSPGSSSPLQNPSSLEQSSGNTNNNKPVADFIGFPEEDAFVEDLRRAAELCVIGENFVTNLQKREDRQKERDTQRWRAARDGFIGDDFDASETNGLDDHSTLDKTDEKTQLFDLFFERMGLALIVDLLSGDTLNFVKNPVYKKNEEELNQSNNSLKEPELDGKTLLPPLTIATQALQSISIMIQNVSRATSLYVILSNNYVNKLIELPLDLYTTAERRRIMSTKEAKSLPSTFASPQITELATHFVTFLKSLAMRMNAETLQFYLKYPSDFPREEVDDEDGTEDSAPEVLDHIPTVQFALYDRALEFCAAHHDSFVRTTALNIALNVLRLTTLAPPDDEVDELGKSTRSNSHHSSSSHHSKSAMGAASPDGVLHNAKALPFRERLAVAQFACIPSRVEHLISPIFVKIAERWSALDEAIRSLDINKHTGASETTDDVTARNERVALAKEKVRRERLIRAFKDKVAELEDELLLLDDVFRVGLTVLNEQMIEMMLATLVYPLLLQPLLLYYQHLTTAIDEDRFSLSEHPFGGISADLSDVDKTLLQVSTPAKSALFTLSLVFKFVSNRPLLRLLNTVLFHPLSPDSNSAPTVRSRLEVATVDRNGRNRIRLDEVNFPREELIPNERTTYAFGTALTNRRASSRTIDPNDPRKSEACVFVLAPALAEVLEYRGQDMALVARARPNPYRRALLKCLTVPEDMSDVRELAICTFNCALSIFDGGFNAAILFGMDLRTFADDIPADERTLDSAYAHADDDRGIGGSVQLESRRYAGPSKGGSVGVDPVTEVVSALCSCVVYASRLPSNEWKLGYDEVAAHTLLTAIRCHPGAIHAAAKLMENKWRQAAILLADVPLGLNPMGGSPFTLPGAPSINDPAYERLIFEAFLNIVFYDPLDLGGTPVTQELFQLPDTDDAESVEGYVVTVSLDCDLKELSIRVSTFLLDMNLDAGPLSYDQEMVYDRRDGARCWFKIDALLTLLNNLAATAGLSLRDASLSGIAFGPDGSVVKLNEAFDKRSIYSNISPDAKHTFFSKHSDNQQPESQSFVDLVGGSAIPCVIEAAEEAAYLFSDEASGIIAEGVTWQSLYLVVIGHFLVFAVPLPDGTGTVGRVITACNLERITLEFDTLEPDDGSSARRIGLNHKWFDKDPPPLFLFDELPEYEENGPFVRVTPFTSRLDVWFENERAASYGYGELCSQIFKAKAHRGRWLRSFLDPQGEHADSPW